MDQKAEDTLEMSSIPISLVGIKLKAQLCGASCSALEETVVTTAILMVQFDALGTMCMKLRCYKVNKI